MRANEFLLETKEDLKLMLILSGIDLDNIRFQSRKIANEYNQGVIPAHAATKVLTPLLITCANLIGNDFWIRNIDDPDLRLVFDSVVNLLDDINDIIKGIK